MVQFQLENDLRDDWNWRKSLQKYRFPAHVKNIGQGTQTDIPSGTKQPVFLFVSHSQQIDCWDWNYNSPNSKDGLQDAALQAPFMVQEEISAEMIWQVILDPRYVISHRCNVFLNAKLPEPDHFLTTCWNVLPPSVHIIHCSCIFGKDVSCRVPDTILKDLTGIVDGTKLQDSDMQGSFLFQPQALNFQQPQMCSPTYYRDISDNSNGWRGLSEGNILAHIALSHPPL